MFRFISVSRLWTVFRFSFEHCPITGGISYVIFLFIPLGPCNAKFYLTILHTMSTVRRPEAFNRTVIRVPAKVSTPEQYRNWQSLGIKHVRVPGTWSKFWMNALPAHDGRKNGLGPVTWTSEIRHNRESRKKPPFAFMINTDVRLLKPISRRNYVVECPCPRSDRESLW